MTKFLFVLYCGLSYVSSIVGWAYIISLLLNTNFWYGLGVYFCINVLFCFLELFFDSESMEEE